MSHLRGIKQYVCTLPGDSDGKVLPAIWEKLGSVPVKIPWKSSRQTTSAFLPGDAPWTAEPGELQKMGSQRIRNDCVTKHRAVYAGEGHDNLFQYS